MFCLLLLVYVSSAMCSEQHSRHRRSWIIESFEIEEGHPGPFPYELGKIHIDKKYKLLFELHGEGVDEEPKGMITINKETGTLYVHKPVDYEERTALKLRLEAKRKDLSIDTKLGIEISIRDINDNPPRFERDLYEITVSEDETQGSHLLTVLAHDRDQRETPNSAFHYEIKSVSPNLPDTKFFIYESGQISFKGCFDHEAADMFTVLVEAKDHGQAVSLSSSTTVIIHIQDGNNHRPIITGQTGSSKVKEGQTGQCPLRLHVTDNDSRNSLAWRARYTIDSDEGEHFKIETDPETNDGVLTVVKPLDFEEKAQRELSIIVENKSPYFSCKVKERTPSGLWKVDTSEGLDSGARQPHSVRVIIEVEDTNDPPVFSVAVKEAMLGENTPVGTWVEKVTAVDPDSSHARAFVYTVGDDPAGWVTVDPLTGDITTVKTPDRESPHVVNGLYTILLYAVDEGEPPLTGTATLQIHVIDLNDNVPWPAEDFVDVCLSNDPTVTSIPTFDPDGDPYGGPFYFELLEDVEGKWKLDPAYGFSAGLVKEPGVYAGSHTISLKISDMQGKFGVYNLSVMVCDCSVTPSCRSHRAIATKAASIAVGIVLTSLFLLLLVLLMAVTISCKKEFIPLQCPDEYGVTLLPSNIERRGSDCKVPVIVLTDPAVHHNPSNMQDVHIGFQNSKFFTKNMEQDLIYNHSVCDDMENWKQTTWNSVSGYSYTHQREDMNNFLYQKYSSYLKDRCLLILIHQRLCSVQETEKDLLDYKPHAYADEEDTDELSELESITISEEDSFKEVLKDLGPRFNELASLCKP